MVFLWCRACGECVIGYVCEGVKNIKVPDWLKVGMLYSEEGSRAWQGPHIWHDLVLCGV